MCSPNQRGFHGYLDNTLASGIPSGMPVFESLVKRKPELDLISSVNMPVLLDLSITSSGWLQPEIEYVYDFIISAGIEPTPFTSRPLYGASNPLRFPILKKIVILMPASPPC
ncbi:hypothetical protein BYT27DRAFT_6449665 [Phlegmacium glaucopus]|nr:hypothetical protein BYT27DRAFT_6449665 [Phlegmacium glaucopus]